MKCQTLLKSKENWRKTVVLIVSGWVLLWPCLKSCISHIFITPFHDSNLLLCVFYLISSLLFLLFEVNLCCFAILLNVSLHSSSSTTGADERETQTLLCLKPSHKVSSFKYLCSDRCCTFLFLSLNVTLLPFLIL